MAVTMILILIVMIVTMSLRMKGIEESNSTLFRRIGPQLGDMMMSFALSKIWALIVGMTLLGELLMESRGDTYAKWYVL